MMWMVPLTAATSAAITLAPFTFTPLERSKDSGVPCRDVAALPPEMSDAVNLGGGGARGRVGGSGEGSDGSTGEMEGRRDGERAAQGLMRADR